YYQADLRWRNNYTELRGGAYGSQHNNTYWANALGSLVWMKDHLFAPNKVNDAFVLVSTDGIGEIPVYYENSHVGNTDRNGYYLINYTPAYYNAKYAIEPLSLAPTIKPEQLEQRLAVKANTGYLLRFPMQQIYPVYLTLVDEQ